MNQKTNESSYGETTTDFLPDFSTLGIIEDFLSMASDSPTNNVTTSPPLNQPTTLNLGNSFIGNQIVTEVSLLTNNQKFPSGLVQGDGVHLFYGSHGASDTYRIDIRVTPVVDQLIASHQTKLNVRVRRENSKEILKKACWTLDFNHRREECLYTIQNNNFPKTRRGKAINEPCLFCFDLVGISNIPEQHFNDFRFQFYSKYVAEANASVETSNPSVSSVVTNVVPTTTTHISQTSLGALDPFNFLQNFNSQQTLDQMYNQNFGYPTETPQSSSSGKKRKKIDIFEPKLHSINPMFGTVGSTLVLLGQFNALSEKSIRVFFDNVLADPPQSVTPNTIVCVAPQHEDGNAFVQVVEEFENFQMRTDQKLFRYISESFQLGIHQLVFNAGPRPHMQPPSYNSPGGNNHTDSSSSSSSSYTTGMFYDSFRQNTLHRAAFDGDLSLVAQILEDGTCDPLSLDNFKRNPFHIACAMGHLSIVEALWTYVVDNLCFEDDEDEDVLASTLLYQKDHFGYTSLTLASKLLDNPSIHPVVFFLKDKMVSYRDLIRKPSFADLVSVEREIHERKINQLTEFFPSLTKDCVRETLERCDWNETDAAALILCEQFENNITTKSSMAETMRKEVFMVIEKQKALNQIIDFMNLSPFTSIANRLIDRFRFFDPEKYFDNFETEIKRKCSKKIHKIENIVRPELQLRFSQYVNQEENPLIFMAFHGTSEHNISSIKKHGLLVPGKGNDIRPVNGSEYGLGIYLSFSGSSSIEYCYGGSKMFVCAVCVRDKIVISEDGNVLVVFDERCVLPCWLITFENRPESVEPPVSINFNNNLLKQI